VKFVSTQPPEKSGLKRDGPVFFSSAPVKVACDAKIYIVILGGAGSLESGAFALSYLLAFLMDIPSGAKTPMNSKKSK